MKFVCLGYYNEAAWATTTEDEQNALMDECFAYDDVLRANGHILGGEALQSVRSTATVQWKNGKVAVTDGPFAETKEQLGGILVIEAQDMAHAVDLISKHPGLKLGRMEIRPVDDMTPVQRASEARRAAAGRRQPSQGRT